MNATELNEKIIERIKSARNERGYSQQVLADALSKTSAAISDMERGKVQVSAGELYIMAKLLDKPIEYFYGEDFGGKDAQDLIAITRLQNPETKVSAFESIKSITTILNIVRKAEKYKNDKDIPNELVIEFYDAFVPFAQTINQMSEQINEIRTLFDKVIEIRKIKLPKR